MIKRYYLVYGLCLALASNCLANSDIFFELVQNSLYAEDIASSKQLLSLERGTRDTTLTARLLIGPLGKYADERVRIARIVTSYTQLSGVIDKEYNAWQHVLQVKDLAAFGFFNKAFHEANRIQPKPPKQKALAYVTIAAKVHKEEKLAQRAWEMAKSLKVKNKEYYRPTWLAAKALVEKSSLRKALDEYLIEYRGQNEDLEYNAQELAKVAELLVFAGYVEDARYYTAELRDFLKKHRAEHRSHWSDIIVDTARLTRWLEGEKASAQFLVNKTSVFGIWPECQMTLKPLLKRHETKAANPLLMKLFKHPPYAEHNQFGELPIFLARGHLYDEAIERIERYERKKSNYYGFSDSELAYARLGVGLLLHRFGRKLKSRKMLQKAFAVLDSPSWCIELGLLFSYWELDFSQEIMEFLKNHLKKK